MWVLSVFLVVVLVYYYLLIFIFFYFLWVYFGLYFCVKINGWVYWVLAGFMVVVQGVKFWFFVNWYDNVKYSFFLDNLAVYFLNYFDFLVYSKFFYNVFIIWYGFFVLLLVVIGFYLYCCYWFKFGLIWLICFGYFMLLYIGLLEFEYCFYVEVNYMALSIFVGVFFFFEVVLLFKGCKLVYFFGGIFVLCFGIIVIYY